MSDTVIRMADDKCLFCDTHGEEAGGHLFIGKYNKKRDWYESSSGWIAINHLTACTIQICPGCAKKYQIREEK